MTNKLYTFSYEDENWTLNDYILPVSFDTNEEFNNFNEVIKKIEMIKWPFNITGNLSTLTGCMVEDLSKQELEILQHYTPISDSLKTNLIEVASNIEEEHWTDESLAHLWDTMENIIDKTFERVYSQSKESLNYMIIEDSKTWDRYAINNKLEDTEFYNNIKNNTDDNKCFKYVGNWKESTIKSAENNTHKFVIRVDDKDTIWGQYLEKLVNDFNTLSHNKEVKNKTKSWMWL